MTSCVDVAVAEENGSSSGWNFWEENEDCEEASSWAGMVLASTKA